MTEPPAVRLRDVQLADLPIHFEHQRDPASNAMAAMQPRDREAFDAHWKKILAYPGSDVLTILAGDEVAGSAVTFVRDGRREVGYWIGREHWGRGIASAALAQLLERTAERPLFAQVSVGNLASRRVLEKCGFRGTGEERDGDVLIRVMRLDGDAAEAGARSGPG